MYANTRYYLSNKFSSNAPDNILTENNAKRPDINSLRETGNIYNLDDQEIPDILTGEIFRAPLKKPDADTKVSSKHTGEPITKV